MIMYRLTTIFLLLIGFLMPSLAISSDSVVNKVLSWSSLFFSSKTKQPPENIKQLFGKEVIVEGYLNNLEGEPMISTILLTSFEAACACVEPPDHDQMIMLKLKKPLSWEQARGYVRAKGKFASVRDELYGSSYLMTEVSLTHLD